MDKKFFLYKKSLEITSEMNEDLFFEFNHLDSLLSSKSHVSVTSGKTELFSGNIEKYLLVPSVTGFTLLLFSGNTPDDVICIPHIDPSYHAEYSSLSGVRGDHGQVTSNGEKFWIEAWTDHSKTSRVTYSILTKD